MHWLTHTTCSPPHKAARRRFSIMFLAAGCSGMGGEINICLLFTFKPFLTFFSTDTFSHQTLMRIRGHIVFACMCVFCTCLRSLILTIMMDLTFETQSRLEI